MVSKLKTLLCILDGWGHSDNKEYNAIVKAKSPNWDRILSKYPNSLLKTSGTDVGLPEGQMGNSEVGHLNIGAGRIVLQLLPKIEKLIKEDKIEGEKIFVDFIDKLKNSGGVCHMLGILSDGGVHGHIDHVLYFAKNIAKQGVEVKIHGVLDGRDTSPKSANKFLKDFSEQIKDEKNISLVSVAGRYYAMDRDNNWDRIEKAYDAIIEGRSDRISNDFIGEVEKLYEQNITDEFIKPIIKEDYQGFCQNDGFFMANYRADRVRQILSAILQDNFSAFKRQKKALAAKLGVAQYSDQLNKILPALFPSVIPKNILSDIIAQNNMKQLHIAETEKYAHVTFFFNGGIEKPKEGEDRILVPSPNVKTYDLKPEMSAEKITHRLLEVIEEDKYDFIVVNFANPDMVGHTGKMQAAIKAVEKIDESLGLLEKAILNKKAKMLITADHGNVEYMYDEKTNTEYTAHTLNLVPCVIIGDEVNFSLKDGRLSDIAPTLLELMNINKPSEMDGNSLIEDK